MLLIVFTFPFHHNTGKVGVPLNRGIHGTVRQKFAGSPTWWKYLVVMSVICKKNWWWGRTATYTWFLKLTLALLRKECQVVPAVIIAQQNLGDVEGTLELIFAAPIYSYYILWMHVTARVRYRWTSSDSQLRRFCNQCVNLLPKLRCVGYGWITTTSCLKIVYSGIAWLDC